MYVAPLIRKLSLRHPMGNAEQQALLSLPTRYAAHSAEAVIVREGTSPTEACLLIEGFAYRERIARSGERQILAVHLPGDLVDLQNALLPEADHTVRALTDTRSVFLPRDALLDLCYRHRAIGEALWLDTLVDASLFREHIVDVGRRDAQTRIAHLLCELGIRIEAIGLGKRDDFELPMTQEKLADCLGLTAVHINRMLKRMEVEGMIERRMRRIRIADWPRLARAGDFDPKYLHLRDGE